MLTSKKQKKQYRAIGHNLKPVVTVAQKGFTKNIRREIDRALTEHELVKVKLLTSERSGKQKLSNEICVELNAECIQSIGNVILLYRATKNPDNRLSNLSRKIS
ncbi:MAG: YhbY family RNA-binding protein [Gammaproteobacteria bacterium]|nr:YhbY family RNA-binding protein [Gammaproteobacteria bacterium]